MRRVAYTVALAFAACMFLFVAVAPSVAIAQHNVSRVAIILAPTLDWDDLDVEHTPNLVSLAEKGALGNIGLRSRAVGNTIPDSSQGALTFSSGSWAIADPLAPTAYSVHERYEGGSAADAFERMTGVSAAGYDIVYLGMPRTQRANSGDQAQSVIVGTLGQAVTDAGGATAAVGTSDSGYEVRGFRRSRPAALVAIDAEGRVRFGEVSSGLLENDPAAPFGYSTDLAALGEAIQDSVKALSLFDDAQLLVIDSGDLQRASEFAPEVSDKVAEEHRRAAIHSLDEVVGMVAESLSDDSAIIVVSHTPSPSAAGPIGFSPLLIAAPGYEGYLTSSSTQRDGLVTNLDLTATVLDILGIEVPVQVIGSPARPLESSQSWSERVSHLASQADVAVAIEGPKWTLINTYIGLTTLLFAFCSLILARAERWPRTVLVPIVSLSSALLILALAVPAASWIMFALEPSPTSRSQGLIWYGVTVIGLWGIGLVLSFARRGALPVAVLSLITAFALMIDQWIGAPWSFTAYFGYSPLLGARYYGIGNEGAAILVGASVVGAALLIDEFREASWAIHLRKWGILAFGLLVTATAAAPFWGANVGVAVWGVVTFGVVWAMMNGIRVGWKSVAIGLIVVIAMVAVFSVIDLSAGGGQTHLGRAWESAGTGGVGELWTIVVRKAQTNLRVLTRTNWTYLLVAVLALLGLMRWRPWGEFAETLEANPAFSDAMAAVLLGGLAAYFTEDSGIIIPALMMLYVGVGIVYLMLGRLRGSRSNGEGEARAT